MTAPVDVAAFGRLLKRARVAAGLTHAGVASLIGFTPVSVAAMEEAAFPAPDPARVARLAAHLRADATALELAAAATRAVCHLWVARWPDGREVRLAVSINPLTGKARASSDTGTGVAHGYTERDAVVFVVGDEPTLTETGEVVDYGLWQARVSRAVRARRGTHD